jgi:hypothetical protein
MGPQDFSGRRQKVWASDWILFCRANNGRKTRLEASLCPAIESGNQRRENLNIPNLAEDGIIFSQKTY